jgi:exopolysaccharide biosynthesis polyprenyl glycosylphosphotransferase
VEALGEKHAAVGGEPTAPTGVVEPSEKRERPVGARRGLPRAEHRLLVAAGDFAVSVVAVAVALAFWSVTAGFPLSVEFMWSRAYWLLAAPIWTAALAPARRARVAFSPAATVQVVARAAFVLLVGYLAVYFNAPRQSLPRLMALHFLWQASLLTVAWRLLYIWIFTETSFRRRMIIVGTGQAGVTILKVIRTADVPQAEVVGFVAEPSADPVASPVPDVPCLGTAADLRAIAARHAVSEIILALNGRAPDALVQALVACQEDGVEVVRMTSVYEELLERVPVQHLEADWLATSFVDAVRAQQASHLAKRLVDLLGAAIGLVVLAMLFPVIALAIWLESGRPIVFRQTRVGRGGQRFVLIKFRTMVAGAEPDGEPRWAAEDDPRATRVGRWLRRTRVDELPQMWNVLKGEMSLVGPRPERPEFVAELERRIPFYRTRLLVRPGLTGWAQVNFPYGDSLADALVKLEYDLYYIKHRSLWFDARIVARTFETLVRMRGR